MEAIDRSPGWCFEAYSDAIAWRSGKSVNRAKDEELGRSRAVGQPLVKKFAKPAYPKRCKTSIIELP